MGTLRLTICVPLLTLLMAAPASAGPAYVKSTVHLRAGASTDNESLGKIPAGSLVDASNCAEGWCEVEWQGKKGFSIATALDLSGRVPIRQRVAPGPRRAYGPVVEDDLVLGPPIYYGPRYYYPYGRPYWYGYYGYRPWGYRRWRYW
jgi:uncharacterized protein YraI